MIIDTNIIVWLLRGHWGAVAFVDRLPVSHRNLSVISQLELLGGARDKEDLQRTRQLLEDEFADIVPLDHVMSGLAGQWMEMYGLSRRPGIPDLLIAATAVARGEALATGNVKDFHFIPGLVIKGFRP